MGMIFWALLWFGFMASIPFAPFVLFLPMYLDERSRENYWTMSVLFFMAFAVGMLGMSDELIEEACSNGTLNSDWSICK